MDDGSVPIGTVADIRQGRYLAKSDMAETQSCQNSVPVHGANGIIGWTTKPMYDFGVPLVTCRGSNSGMILWADGPLWVSNNAMAILPTNGHRKFAYYALLNAPPYAAVSGSAQPQITRTALAPREYYWPDDEEQESIANVLSSLDDKIELNRRMNATLEGMAQAIFRDWFVDFGPVRRKMGGETDPVAILGGLIPDPAKAATLAALFPDALGDDGLPMGWEWMPLSDQFRLTMGQSPPGDTYNDVGEGLPFFQGRTDFGFRYPENRKFCSAPTRIAQADDTLVSVRAPVGDLNMAWEESCIGRGVAAVRHPAGPAFTYCTLQSLKPELKQFEDAGTVFGAINKKQFEQLKTVGAPRPVVEAFEELTGVTVSRIRAATAENRTLAETRDYLLPRLMSGKVRVADAERMVGV